MPTQYYVGIDIAAASFVATVLSEPQHVVLEPKTFSNDPAGFDELLSHLQKAQVQPGDTRVCLEATGVYGEALAYFLAAADWWVAVHPPLEVKRAFYPSGQKSDQVDSRQIAEFAARFRDRLRRFQPKRDILEQVRVLLTTREQFVRQKTASLNALQALRRKVVRSRLAEEMHQTNVQRLSQHIQALEQEIQRLFKDDPDLHHNLLLLLTIPGVGLLLAAHTLVVFESMDQPYNPRAWAAYLGIAPLPNQSGTSRQRPARSRRVGPSPMRKLLHLGARSVRTHRPAFRHYFERKVAQGKPKSLVLNNIANQLLRIICAVLRDQKPYIPDYRSVHPALLQKP